MLLSNKELNSRYEKALVKKDLVDIVRTRFALMQYDDYSFGDNGGGSETGSALTSILSAVGAGVSAGANIYQASQYGSTTSQPTLIHTNAVSAHSGLSGIGTWLAIGLLLLVGLFAYKKL